MTETQIQLVPSQPLQGILKTVALDQVTPNEQLRGDEPNPAFVRNIADWGVLEPIQITDCPNGPAPYKVIDGARRVKAARANQLDEIQAVYYNDEALEWRAELALISNELRSPNTRAQIMDLGELVAQGYGADAIAEKTQMRKGTIKARLKLLNLIGPLLDAFYDGSMSVGAAQEACTLPASVQFELARPLLAGEVTTITRDDVHAIRQTRHGAVTEDLDLGEAIAGAHTPANPAQIYLSSLQAALSTGVKLPARERKSLEVLIAKARSRADGA